MQRSADVVIVGAGVTGCSIAYHLTRLGITGILLVEKMASEIAGICLLDPQVERAIVRVEKPGALRFARSVGVEIDRTRTR